MDHCRWSMAVMVTRHRELSDHGYGPSSMDYRLSPILHQFSSSVEQFFGTGHIQGNAGRRNLTNFSCGGDMISANSLTLSALPAQQPRYNWLFKYKLYHIPFWFVYHYMWWTVNIGNAWTAAHNIFFSPYAVKYCFYVVFQAVGAYFNLYFLIPRYLEKGQYVHYISLLILTMLCTAMLIVPGYYVSAWLSDKTFHELYQTDPGNYLRFLQINTLPSTVASTTLAMSIKLTKNWIQARRREQLLEKEKLETELKFLRSQFNPHFLFNTINSIFVLIHKNPVMASESLAKFSDLLRYQLYECNEHQIPLEQELTYLENYIELQKLRQDHGNINLTVQLTQQPSGDLTIAPFVLIPFIENAFKHVSQRKDQSNWIKMDLRCDQYLLHFNISNSTSSQYHASGEIIRHSGIGLKNVQRRLDLVYPGKHNLTIRHDSNLFRVTLQLNLNGNTVPEWMTNSGAIITSR
jgi:two-component system, LytTR family, sensor kinase